MPTVISVENLSKTYRLGQIGTGTFAHDLYVWWARARGAWYRFSATNCTNYAKDDGTPRIARIMRRMMERHELHEKIR